MSTGEKKPAPPATSPPTPAQQSKPSQPVKNPLVSRRTFLRAAVGASTVLAAASMASSGQILAPLIPTPKGPEIIANALDLESDYAGLRGTGKIAYRFFFWPFEESVSPYYKNILARVPDELLPVSDRGPMPSLSHYVAWNMTCVHLRCIVLNPTTIDNEYRIPCPCHGSQYRLTDAVPVKGPAFLLGLRPLPRIKLSLDSGNNIVAENLEGEPGVGRTTP